MARFFFPKKFFHIKDDGTLKAFFAFRDEETGVEYLNFRLVDGEYGPFASSPFNTWKPEDAEKPIHTNLVRPGYDANQEDKKNKKGKEWFAQLTKEALAFYESAKNSGSSEGSGRGPDPSSEPADDDLPF